jgi:serine/threonine protein kinase
MAPESLLERVYSSQSDVWSFGVLMWEIVTLGCTPYTTMSPQEIPKKLINENFRLPMPDCCKRDLYCIMCYCWDMDPKLRPSFKALREELSKLMLQPDDYIELDRFPDRCYYNLITQTSEERL